MVSFKKCPSCGRELTPDRVLVPIYDVNGKLLDAFCVNKETFDKFKRHMKEKNLSFSDFIEWAIRRIREE